MDRSSYGLANTPPLSCGMVNPMGAQVDHFGTAETCTWESGWGFRLWAFLDLEDRIGVWMRVL